LRRSLLGFSYSAALTPDYSTALAILALYVNWFPAQEFQPAIELNNVKINQYLAMAATGSSRLLESGTVNTPTT